MTLAARASAAGLACGLFSTAHHSQYIHTLSKPAAQVDSTPANHCAVKQQVKQYRSYTYVACTNYDTYGFVAWKEQPEMSMCLSNLHHRQGPR